MSASSSQGRNKSRAIVDSEDENGGKSVRAELAACGLVQRTLVGGKEETEVEETERQREREREEKKILRIVFFEI